MQKYKKGEKDLFVAMKNNREVKKTNKKPTQASGLFIVLIIH